MSKEITSVQQIVEEIEFVQDVLHEALDEPNVWKMNVATAGALLTSLLQRISTNKIF